MAARATRVIWPGYDMWVPPLLPGRGEAAGVVSADQAPRPESSDEAPHVCHISVIPGTTLCGLPPANRYGPHSWAECDRAGHDTCVVCLELWEQAA